MSKNYFGITDIGQVRTNNEDTFIAEMVGDYIVAAAIDGVGGYEGGEIAARLARESILKYVQTSHSDPIKLMKDAINAANEAIYAEKLQNKDTAEMACVLTLAIVDINNNKFYYAHVGDTRLYLFRDNGMIKLTKDHSFVGYLEDSGRLTEEAAMRHPKRNEINKGLGLDPKQNILIDYIDTSESPFLPGDIILLCSDGLTDMIDLKTMTAILNTSKSLAQKGKELIEAANSAGGKDNITAVLVQNDKTPQVLTATRPANNKAEEVIAQTNRAEAAVVPKKKRPGNGTLIGLLCIALLILSGWLFYLLISKPKEKEITPLHKVRNPAEERLISLLNDSNYIKIIPPLSGPLILSGSIIIHKDSSHIFGRGIHLLRDSSFSGPALISYSTNLSLDSITFENFDIGIITGNHVRLRNVQFKNCKIPVLSGTNIYNGQLLTGTISSAVFYPDSSAK